VKEFGRVLRSHAMVLALGLMLVVTQGAPDDAPRNEARVVSLSDGARPSIPGWFAAPKVNASVLGKRVGLGLLSSLGGGVVAMGFLGVGYLFTASVGGAAPILISAPFAVAALGFGAALGAAVSGRHFGADYRDALVVSLLASCLSVAAVIIGIATSIEVFVPAVIIGMLFPGVVTPLVVQLLMKDPASSGVTVAWF
jgi:hypothetical protein